MACAISIYRIWCATVRTFPFSRPSDAYNHQRPTDPPSYNTNNTSTYNGAPNSDLGDTSPGDFIFPSLPVESPSSSIYNAFGAIPQQDLPPIERATDVWPASVSEQTLLPWIDVYYKRLHPTIPILNRANMYCDMLLRKHRVDPQYGAMLLGLCAFAMEQPVQIHERAMKASRSQQARMLLHECAKMRVSANFGEEPTIEMILTSFFMFACLLAPQNTRLPGTG